MGAMDAAFFPLSALPLLMVFPTYLQLGQQGNWLVLEDTILEITEHRDACGYAGVKMQV